MIPTVIDADARALTLKNPWPFAMTSIEVDPKRPENRGWPPPESVDVLMIHAGKGWDRDAPEWLTAAAKGSPTSAIVAVGRLAFCCRITVGHPERRCNCGRWAAAGQYHWMLYDDLVVLDEPVSCAGKLGLWKPAPPVLDAVREQLRLTLTHRIGAGREF